MRAGREPAEDLKRCLVAACQEAGLLIDNANMHLLRESESRLIHVGASVAGWSCDTPMLSVMATMPVTGDWPTLVDIRCCAAEESAVSGDCLWMQGRSRVALNELVQELHETLHEREQVLAARKMGIRGPYPFKQSVWRPVDLFDEPNQP